MGFMIEEALRYARAQGLLHRGMHVLVACSGGPDSLALLDILLRLRGRLRLALTVAHFEHGIRGASSEGDASFVAAFCKERGVPCFIGHGDVPSAARAQGKSLELAARELRYAFFWQTMARVGADVLATAHHADDQAETVLMRILRGTGLDGLSAMKPREGKKIRPLLFARRAEILAYCGARGLEPRHDATNDLPDCTRNVLRLKVLPYLQQSCNPEVARALCQLAELARADCDYLEQQLDAIWPYLTREEEGQRKIVLASLRRQHPAMQRRALRRLYREAAGSGRDLSFIHAEELRQLAISERPTGKVLALSGGYRACFSYDRLFLRQSSEEVSEAPADLAVRPEIPGVTEAGASSSRRSSAGSGLHLPGPAPSTSMPTSSRAARSSSATGGPATSSSFLLGARNSRTSSSTTRSRAKSAAGCCCWRTARRSSGSQAGGARAITRSPTEQRESCISK